MSVMDTSDLSHMRLLFLHILRLLDILTSKNCHDETKNHESLQKFRKNRQSQESVLQKVYYTNLPSFLSVRLLRTVSDLKKL